MRSGVRAVLPISTSAARVNQSQSHQALPLMILVGQVNRHSRRWLAGLIPCSIAGSVPAKIFLINPRESIAYIFCQDHSREMAARLAAILAGPAMVGRPQEGCSSLDCPSCGRPLCQRSQSHMASSVPPRIARVSNQKVKKASLMGSLHGDYAHVPTRRDKS